MPCQAHAYFRAGQTAVRYPALDYGVLRQKDVRYEY